MVLASWPSELLEGTNTFSIDGALRDLLPALLRSHAGEVRARLEVANAGKAALAAKLAALKLFSEPCIRYKTGLSPEQLRSHAQEVGSHLEAADEEEAAPAALLHRCFCNPDPGMTIVIPPAQLRTHVEEVGARLEAAEET